MALTEVENKLLAFIAKSDEWEIFKVLVAEQRLDDEERLLESSSDRESNIIIGRISAWKDLLGKVEYAKLREQRLEKRKEMSEDKQEDVLIDANRERERQKRSAFKPASI